MSSTAAAEKVVQKATVGPSDNRPSYAELEEMAGFLLHKSHHRPKIAIICGTGLGSLASELEDKDEIPYGNIPNFPTSTVKGHAGQMVLGLMGGTPLLCMQGRFHAYEGYPLWKCTMPVRVMKLMGIEQLIVTNAAGGLREDFRVGDIMVIKDHINSQSLVGDSPLRGPNEERFGPRFPNLANLYDRDLRKAALEISQQIGNGDVVKEGVYALVGGPNFQTVAEVKMLKMQGADAVGMSTVHEVLVARHCGLKVFGFSLITDKADFDYDTDAGTTHEKVLQSGANHQKNVKVFVKQMVTRMAVKNNSKL